MSSFNPPEIQRAIIIDSRQAIQRINDFSRETLRTRGGRIGSGMGTLLEALWGYYINQVASERHISNALYEMAWIPSHQYNDFACIQRDSNWSLAHGEGEILRIELKSMVSSADESKAHFDQLMHDIGQNDLLVVIVWDWVEVDEIRVSPQILDHFVGPAIPIANLRDQLHLARGGSFVDRNTCPDGCEPTSCSHDEEPLNANGRRERLSGPRNRRVSRTVSYAANYGGMVRMLKTDSDHARETFRELRRNNDTAHEYISFIHRNFPVEELNQYTAEEWRRVSVTLGLELTRMPKPALVERIRNSDPNYQDHLRH